MSSQHAYHARGGGKAPHRALAVLHSQQARAGRPPLPCICILHHLLPEALPAVTHHANTQSPPLPPSPPLSPGFAPSPASLPLPSLPLSSSTSSSSPSSSELEAYMVSTCRRGTGAGANRRAGQPSGPQGADAQAGVSTPQAALCKCSAAVPPSRWRRGAGARGRGQALLDRPAPPAAGGSITWRRSLAGMCSANRRMSMRALSCSRRVGRVRGEGSSRSGRQQARQGRWATSVSARASQTCVGADTAL